MSRRQDRPNAILWLVRNHPELKDSAIMRLVGTTKSTIAAIRERTHWNAAALQPMDPVTLGLATQTDLDFEVNRANKEKPAPADTGATLLPAAETTARKEAEEAAPTAASENKPGGAISTSARCSPSSSSSAAKPRKTTNNLISAATRSPAAGVFQ